MSPVAIVTGAFGALGRAVATRLAADGLQLALADAAPAPADADHGEWARRLTGALWLPGVDLADSAAARAAVEHCVQHFGALDVVANIAGGFAWQPVADGDSATWEAQFRGNVLSALAVSRAALPHLRGRQQACIVNVGAAAAARAGAGMGAYTAAKSGVLRLTEALAEEVKAEGLRVNAVLPSILDTPANRRDMPGADPARWVAPEALADVIAFLVGPGARAIHGAAIPVIGRV